MLGYVVKAKPRHALLLLVAGYLTYVLAQVLFTENVDYPVLLWWTPFVSGNRLVACKNHECLITDDRNHKNIKALLFYGSNIEDSDLPLPKGSTPWALYHEESPKNLPTLLDVRVQALFETTATFSRYSSLPLTLQYLESLALLTTAEYFVDLKRKNELLDELAPVLYIQSDCDTPIERDKIVRELMEYVKVDSYGKCLNNKEMPEKFKLNGTYDLYGSDFMKFVAQYKFVISIENARCFDYITEKLWRPLIVGSVPIYLGSSSVKDWLPNENSAILIDDFISIKDLAEHITAINEDDRLYASFLAHKTRKKITNELLRDSLSKGLHGIENSDEFTISAFECFVCEKTIAGDHPKPERSVYECDEPITKPGDDVNPWAGHWEWGRSRVDEIVQRLQS